MAPRLTAAVVLLALLHACATPPVVRLDPGLGAPLEYRLPTSDKPVKVGAEAFEEALTHLMLEVPLTLPPPPQGGWVRASYPSNDPATRWQSLMSKSFGGMCEPGQRRETCLSLLDDVLGLSPWDKLGVALGLSIDPLKESISRAVEKTLAPQLFFTVIAGGLITWAVLAANPEPLFTKAAALLSALLLIQLGVEAFLELVDATRELKQATDRATTWEELESASLRWANRVGPEVARVFVLTVTVVVSHGMIGGSAALASRLSRLPPFPQAAAGASRFGINLANVGEVSRVSVVGSTIVISLPATAVAMTAWNGVNSRNIEALLRPGGRLIGEEGSSPQVRILKGGLNEAQKLFEQLSAGGTPIQATTYPGTLVRLPTGGTVGLRPVSTSGPPTIDVRIPGIGIREIKFTP
ncbi:MAG TPA: hypothetical protein VF815_23060 [Myxococcaceae bacterium]